MASEDRTAAPAVDLLVEMQQDPYRFDFFQAVRRIECLHPDKPRIGQTLRPSEEAIRLGQDPSLAFAGSTLASCGPTSRSARLRLAGYFFGLLGPNGPLPIHLTEYAYDRLRHGGDPTLSRFLDVFHHRMISLFYRAWAVNRPTVSYDRPEQDWFGVYLATLIGLGMPELRRRDAMPDRAKLFYAGLLAAQTHHPDGLAAMVADFFGIPARIEEFVGEWILLPEAGRCRLGLTPETGTLGETAVIGMHVWSTRHRFRIVLGPLGLADFLRFLPIGSSLARLVAMVRSYAGDELAWVLNPVLKGAEVPPCRLGASARLGWTTWLATDGLPHDARDLELEPMVYAH